MTKERIRTIIQGMKGNYPFGGMSDTEFICRLFYAGANRNEIIEDLGFAPEEVDEAWDRIKLSAPLAKESTN